MTLNWFYLCLFTPLNLDNHNPYVISYDKICHFSIIISFKRNLIFKKIAITSSIRKSYGYYNT